MPLQLLALRGMKFSVGGKLSDPRIGIKTRDRTKADYRFEVVFEQGQRIQFSSAQGNLLHKNSCATIVYHRDRLGYILDGNSMFYPFGFEDDFALL